MRSVASAGTRWGVALPLAEWEYGVQCDLESHRSWTWQLPFIGHTRGPLFDRLIESVRMRVAFRLGGFRRRRRPVTAPTSSNGSSNDDSGCIWRALCGTLAWNRFSPQRTSWLPAPEATRCRGPHGVRSGSQSSSLSSSVLLSVVVLRGDLRVEPDSGRRPTMHAGHARPGADLIRYRREPTFKPYDADQHVTGDVDGTAVEFRSLGPTRCQTVIALGHRVLLGRERISVPNTTSGYTINAVLRRVATHHDSHALHWWTRRQGTSR
jgi:hypothetical protein